MTLEQLTPHSTIIEVYDDGFEHDVAFYTLGLLSGDGVSENLSLLWAGRMPVWDCSPRRWR